MHGPYHRRHAAGKPAVRANRPCMNDSPEAERANDPRGQFIANHERFTLSGADSIRPARRSRLASAPDGAE